MAEQQTKDTGGSPQRQPGSKDMASWKPGSEPEEAKNVGAPDDFGVPVGSGSSRQREYVSENTKMSDPGAAAPFAHESSDGVRTSGAGARAEGEGSGSEGDIDTEVIGVGFGGVAATGPDDDLAADETDGTSNEFAGKLSPDTGNAEVIPAQGRVPATGDRPRGSFVQGPDMQSESPAQGADAATNPSARGDDAFTGEISSGEASGQDLGMSPSSDTQGLDEGDNQTSGGNQKDFADEG